MKRRFAIGVLVLTAIIAAMNFGSIVSGQEEVKDTGFYDMKSAEIDSPESELLAEDFSYSAGQLTTVSGGNWVNFSGTGNFLQVSSGGLSYSGYAGSGVGNKVDIISVGSSAEDAYRQFTTQTGTTYAAFMLNVTNTTGLLDNTSTTGDYFAGFLPSASTTALVSRVSIRLGATPGTYQLGLRATSANAATAFSTTDLNPGTTYLVVISYEIVAGNSNDPVNMWINPTLGGSQPAATVSQTTATTTDNVDTARFFIRQGTTTTPNASIDGIRVGTSWADVAGGGGGGPVVGPKLFKAYLNSSNEVPPNASTATGFGRVVLNAAETEIKASLYWNNLTGNATSAHIHGPAAVGANASPIFNLNPPAQASGSVVDFTTAVSPAQVADLKAGLWYFNVHTATNGGGEIRGQITRARPRFDTDGDGDSDYGVIRPGAGGGAGQATWYTSLNQGTATDPSTVNQWGLNSDTATPGDFDGDGKTDIAFWRQSGTPGFYILRSSTGTLQQINFGLPGDDPTIVADYSGDGKDDAAIYRPGASAGAQSFFWTIPSSGPLANTQVVQPWGLGSDLATTGDFDGDGRADLCVTRNFSGANVFIVYTASGNASYTAFGLSGANADAIVPGDYDGDGKTDFAVTRIESGQIAWYYRPSGGGSDTRVAWGTTSTGDIEAQGDYDGDGKTDIAVWRSSGNSTFYVVASSGGFRFQRWGLTSDFPSIFDLH